MKNLTNRWVRPAALPQFPRMHLTRTFVETGDERCPIAGIWSRLDNDATTDDSELTWPAAWRLPRGEPFHLQPAIFFEFDS